MSLPSVCVCAYMHVYGVCIHACLHVCRHTVCGYECMQVHIYMPEVDARITLNCPSTLIKEEARPLRQTQSSPMQLISLTCCLLGFLISEFHLVRLELQASWPPVAIYLGFGNSSSCPHTWKDLTTEPFPSPVSIFILYLTLVERTLPRGTDFSSSVSTQLKQFRPRFLRRAFGIFFQEF